MQKKDDKVGNKTANKEGKKGSERERSKMIRQKRSKFGFLRTCEETKKLFNYVRLVGKYVFFLEKFVFSHSYTD